MGSPNHKHGPVLKYSCGMRVSRCVEASGHCEAITFGGFSETTVTATFALISGTSGRCTQYGPACGSRESSWAGHRTL
jgi:hypothetical protein